MAVTFDPPQVPLARDPVVTAVFRHDGKGNSRLLPLVLCLSVTQVEGSDPGSARFRYILDDSIPDSPYPNQFEQFYPLDAVSPFVVRQDDQIEVKAWDGYGKSFILFDGFAQVGEIGLTPDGQEVSFTAIGVGIRLWDLPAEGAVYRDADVPDAGDPIPTGLPVRFNPNDSDNISRPNATDVGVPYKSTTVKLFLEPNLKRDPDPRVFWELADAVKYLLWRSNRDETYVSNGDIGDLDNLLKSIAPKKAGGAIDISKPDTYETKPIIMPDYDPSNNPAIMAVDDLLSANGFAMRFAIETDPAGIPKTRIKVYRRDGLFGDAPLDLYLGKPGTINPGTFNVGSMSLSRDIKKVANSFEIESAPIRYECSLILAPGFVALLGDETDANRKKWVMGNWDVTTDRTTREAYRLYLFDECGDGHFDTRTRAWVANTPGDLSSILNLGADGKPNTQKTRRFAKRYRPALGKLVARDGKDRPVRCRLDFSRDYKGKLCNPWDGTGTWQTIDSGWVLDRDRLGILVTCENPEEWFIGDFRGANPQNPGKHLRGVTALAKPTAPAPAPASVGIYDPFYLRLTCVIEGDFGLTATTERRATSPTRFTIRQRIDARQDYVKEVVDKSSAFFKQADKTRDDTERALAYAKNMTATHEVAPSSGTVVIPRFTDAYPVGGRVRSIAGRDCSLRSNAGAQQGERPQYPTITAITWTLSPNQSTTLTLSDRLPDPLPL